MRGHLADVRQDLVERAQRFDMLRDADPDGQGVRLEQPAVELDRPEASRRGR